jgi:DNA-binding response OmpR family regulator
MSPEHFHVLVAADEQSLRRSLVDSLTAAGFSLEEVSSGTEATEVILHRRVDLVLLSLNLPDGRGIENCRKLRALAPDLGIVMIRANGTPADDIPALDAGADDCVAAPFRFREIVARLGAVLRRAQVENTPKASVLRAGDIRLDVERRQFWPTAISTRPFPKSKSREAGQPETISRSQPAHPLSPRLFLPIQQLPVQILPLRARLKRRAETMRLKVCGLAG